MQSRAVNCVSVACLLLYQRAHVQSRAASIVCLCCGVAALHRCAQAWCDYIPVGLLRALPCIGSQQSALCASHFACALVTAAKALLRLAVDPCFEAVVIVIPAVDHQHFLLSCGH